MNLAEVKTHLMTTHSVSEKAQGTRADKMHYDGAGFYGGVQEITFPGTEGTVHIMRSYQRERDAAGKRMHK